MKQAIQDIKAASDEIAQDLSAYATRAAIVQLTSNWEDALKDNNPLFDAAAAARDIDEVIQNLESLKLRLSGESSADRNMRIALGLEVD